VSITCLFFGDELGSCSYENFLKRDGLIVTTKKEMDKRLNPERLGGEERRLMHLVPAPAVRLMKRRVLSRPGINSLVHERINS